MYSKGVGNSLEEAEKLISDFYTAYPNVKMYLETQVYDALNKGYTQDAYGRVRWYDIPERDGKNEEEVRSAIASTRRQAMNFSIQSCKYGDDLIFTKEEGFVKISSLEGKGVVSFWDGESWSEGWVKKSSGVKEAYRLTLGNGMSTVSSIEHRYKVDGKGFIPLSDITISDSVYVTSAIKGSFPEIDVKEDSLFSLLAAKTSGGVAGQMIGLIYTSGMILGNDTLLLKSEDSDYLTSLGFERREEVYPKVYDYYKKISKEDAEFFTEIVKGNVPSYTFSNSNVMSFIHTLFGDHPTFRNFPARERNLARKVQIVLKMLGVETILSEEEEYVSIFFTNEGEKVYDSLITREVVQYEETYTYEVKSIESLQESIAMYDLMDTYNEQFCGDGIIVHNCSASITKIAIRDIYNYFTKENKGKKGRMLLTIHDSIFFEIPVEDNDSMVNNIETLKSLMEGAAPQVIPEMVAPVDYDLGEKVYRVDPISGEKFSVYEKVIENGIIVDNPQIYSESTLKKIKSGEIKV